MKKYTAVAAIDHTGVTVAMVLKGHGPEAVIGKWNFIGGQVEEGETSLICAEREFREETGYAGPLDLDHSITLLGNGWGVDFYLAKMREQYNLPSRNDAGEVLDRFGLRQVHQVDVVPNLNWIWPLMLDLQIQKPVVLVDIS